MFEVRPLWLPASQLIPGDAEKQNIIRKRVVATQRAPTRPVTKPWLALARWKLDRVMRAAGALQNARDND